MASLGHHLARRAVEVAQNHITSPSAFENVNSGSNSQDEPEIKMIATWGIVLLWVTAVLYMSIMSAVRGFAMLCVAGQANQVSRFPILTATS